MGGFKLISPRDVPQSRSGIAPHVSIRRDGNIVFNLAAVEKYRIAGHVEIRYDTEGSRFGFCFNSKSPNGPDVWPLITKDRSKRLGGIYLLQYLGLQKPSEAITLPLCEDLTTRLIVAQMKRPEGAK